LINWHFRNSQNKAKLSVAETIQWAASYQFEGLFNSGGVKFKINAVEFISLADFQLALLTTSGGEDVEIEVVNQSAVNSYFTDQVFQIEYGTNDTTVYPLFRQHTIEFSDAKVGCDRMIMNTHRLELNPLTSAHSPMRLGIRTLPTTTSDYNSFPYSLANATDIANANVALAAIADGTPYALHFWFGWNGNFPAGSPLTTGNIDGSFQYRFLDAPYSDNYFIHRSAGEDSFPLNIPQLANNGAVYDGVTRYELVENVPNTYFRAGKPFLIHIEYFINNFSANNALWSTCDLPASNTNQAFTLSGIGSSVCISMTYTGRAKNYCAPQKQGWNSVIAYYNGGNVTDPNSFTIIATGDTYTGSRLSQTGSNYTGWTGENTTNVMTVGRLRSSSLIRWHRGRIRYLAVAAGEFILPDDMEIRTMQNVHGATHINAYNGEPYNFGAAPFHIFCDFDKTGTDPITVSGSEPFTVTSFGNRSYSPYLI
jgi:hypothetical protein